jgi:hypothetical protein
MNEAGVIRRNYLSKRAALPQHRALQQALQAYQKL